LPIGRRRGGAKYRLARLLRNLRGPGAGKICALVSKKEKNQATLKGPRLLKGVGKERKKRCGRARRIERNRAQACRLPICEKGMDKKGAKEQSNIGDALCQAKRACPDGAKIRNPSRRPERAERKEGDETGGRKGGAQLKNEKGRPASIVERRKRKWGDIPSLTEEGTVRGKARIRSVRWRGKSLENNKKSWEKKKAERGSPKYPKVKRQARESRKTWNQGGREGAAHNRVVLLGRKK